MAYLLDANVFIQAKNLQYGFDFCPAFWDWLDVKYVAGELFSIQQVGDELCAGDDELSAWAEARGEGFFLSPDAAVMSALPNLSLWANTQSFRPAAVSTFLQSADYWLVAHAVAHGHVLVTHEVPSDGLSRIKIPNACVAMGVQFVSPYQMLRRERARFVLGA
ncbi:DUF4411 family protein [Perlucidibaca piscinae]|uniref:DUF4411 family protein n=1 Tax=Perlucidibaca piscinae TaxID=392589 RepID=UPI0003B35009|nr:DUF4411 family protein [Perlucidibaca piscinae]